MQQRLPPGPPPRKGGLLGNLRYGVSMLWDAIGFVERRFETFGDIYCAPNPDGHLYVLRHPEHIGEVLRSRAADFGKTHTALQRIGDVLGDGLLTSDGDLWRRHRRMIQPAFHRAKLAAYADSMVAEAARTADAWADGRRRDMSTEMMALTLRIVSQTLFSHDIGDGTGGVGQAMNALHAALNRPFLPDWVKLPSDRAYADGLAHLDGIIEGMLDARGGDGDGPTDLLQMLVTAEDEDGSRLSRKEVRDHLLTFFLAGHETTSHALTWTLYLLAQNPAVADALHAELAGHLGDRLPTIDDLDALPLTERVMKESMRLYPPAYAIARRAERDTSIGAWPVAAGSEVVSWIYFTHRDRRWFPEPDRFDPSRFEAEAEAARPRTSYLPFGAGQRMCIGHRFAMVEAQLVLAVLARRYRFRVAAGQRVGVRPRVTLTPRWGMRMDVETR